MTADFHPVGAETRRDILGNEHVDKLAAQVSEFDRAWNMYVTNISWGGTWTRGIIDRPTLSLASLALLAGAGQFEEFERHMRNALLRTHVPLMQLRELLLHIGHYCGIPTGAACFAIARRVIREEGIDVAAAEFPDVGSSYRINGSDDTGF